ncbi:hypothetical protein QAD02_007379 [Eretmocerus hayati]|uniref:Uncharacterized protein n=1 Tax=Eretmocerus hayati TaxID=131215 RepID=A0ACC2N3H9_9HYME|nr:hypothetical protein QAD02_007379 [Eretmocerus hayati]
MRPLHGSHLAYTAPADRFCIFGSIVADARLEIYQEEVDVVLPMEEVSPEKEGIEVLYDANNPLLDAQDPLAEDEQDPVFQRYEGILDEPITSAREDLVDLVHRAYADAIGNLRAEIAGAEARRVAERQPLESRLQEFRSEILDMLSNARVEGRAELGCRAKQTTWKQVVEPSRRHGNRLQSQAVDIGVFFHHRESGKSSTFALACGVLPAT